MATKLILGPVRFSYCHLDEPYSMREDEAKKYSVMLLIPKDDDRQMAMIKQAIKDAEQDALNNQFKGKMPAKVNNPFHDGDGLKSNGEEYGEECKGHYVVTVTSNEKYPPGLVVGPDKRPAESGEIYSGCYGYASLNLNGYNHMNKKGIGAYLNNVWKTRDGEALGGVRANPQDEFANIEADFSGLREIFPDDDLPF